MESLLFLSKIHIHEQTNKRRSRETQRDFATRAGGEAGGKGKTGGREKLKGKKITSGENQREEKIRLTDNIHHYDCIYIARKITRANKQTDFLAGARTGKQGARPKLRVNYGANNAFSTEGNRTHGHFQTEPFA